MWLFTKYGFFSVTQSRQEPGKIQIRARAKEDLENLTAFAGSFGWRVGKYFSEIIETPDADYRYRIICSINRWGNIAEMLVRDIDYSNFKNQIKDPARHRLYERVWGVMLALQRPAIDRRQLDFFTLDDLDDAEEDPELLDDLRRLEADASAPILDEDDDPTDPFYDPGRQLEP